MQSVYLKITLETSLDIHLFTCDQVDGKKQQPASQKCSWDPQSQQQNEKSSVNGIKQHYLMWLYLEELIQISRWKDLVLDVQIDGGVWLKLPRCNRRMWQVGARTPHGLHWQGRGSAPFPLPQPCPGSPVGTRSAGAYLPHSHWRFELRTGTSLPPRDTAHQREMSAKSMGRCQLTTSCSIAPRHPPYAGAARLQWCATWCGARCTTMQEKAERSFFCLAAAINITTINNRSLKPRDSFTPLQLQNGNSRMVARGDVSWPELPA